MPDGAGPPSARLQSGGASLGPPLPASITPKVGTLPASLPFLPSPLSCCFPLPQPYFRPPFLTLVAAVFSLGDISVSCQTSPPPPRAASPGQNIDINMSPHCWKPFTGSSFPLTVPSHPFHTADSSPFPKYTVSFWGPRL